MAWKKQSKAIVIKSRGIYIVAKSVVLFSRTKRSLRGETVGLAGLLLDLLRLEVHRH